MSISFKQKVNKVYDVCSSLCPVCDRTLIERTTIELCEEGDTLIDYDELLHVVLAKLDDCERCQSKENFYEE